MAAGLFGRRTAMKTRLEAAPCKRLVLVLAMPYNVHLVEKFYTNKGLNTRLIVRLDCLVRIS